MDRKCLLLCCLVLAMLQAYGQDVITRTDGVALQARVREVTPSLIWFYLAEGSDTLLYQISTRDVQTLQLADGTRRSFTSPSANDKPHFDYVTQSGRHILSYYPFDLIYGQVTLAYERVLPSGKVGLKVPLVLGFVGDRAENYYQSFRRNTRYGAGLEVNFYPFGHGRFQFYAGPALSIRSLRSYYFARGQPQPEKEYITLSALALKAGLYYQVSRHFQLSGDFGVGYRFFRDLQTDGNSYYSSQPVHNYFPFNFHLGYRF